MIRASVQMAAAWLAHATHGANALAAGLPTGSDSAPAAVAIFNTSDHKEVARTFEPPASPALIVWCETTARASARNYRVARDLTLGVAYVTDDQADEDVARSDADYLMRAVLQSFGRFGQSSIAKPYRTKNGVVIAMVGDADYTHVTGAVGRTRVWAMLACTLTVADVVGALSPAMPSELVGSP